MFFEQKRPAYLRGGYVPPPAQEVRLAEKDFPGNAIPKYKYQGRQDITSVTIGADIIDIDEGAFNGCVNLRTVKLPCHLESIGAYAFYNCKSLQELYIPGTLRILRVSAFSGCIKLANLRYPPDIKDRLLVYGHSVWANCPLLPAEEREGWEGGHYSTVDFEPGITRLPRNIFAKLDGLRNVAVRSVMLPATVTEIEDGAFRSCTQMVRAILPKGLKVLPKDLFYNCRSLKEMVVPESVVSVGEHAFYRCRALRTINLPRGLRKLGDYAFRKCEGLHTLKFGSEDLKTSLKLFGNGVFDGCDSLDEDYEEGWEVHLTQDDFVTHGSTIETGEHKNRHDIVSIDLCESVSKIGSEAFRNCLNLKRVILPPFLAIISDDAFRGCKNLEEVLIPGTVHYLGRRAFSGCTGLKALSMFRPHPHMYDAEALRGYGCVLKVPAPWSWDANASKAMQPLKSYAATTLAAHPHSNPGRLMQLAIEQSTRDGQGQGRGQGLASRRGGTKETAIVWDAAAKQWAVDLGPSESANPPAAEQPCVVHVGGAIWEMAGGSWSAEDAATAHTFVEQRRKDYASRGGGGGGGGACALSFGLELQQPDPDSTFAGCANLVFVTAPDSVIKMLGKPYADATLLSDLPLPMVIKAMKRQVQSYYWSMMMHRETNVLSKTQRAWVKHVLTVGSRARLHWRPFNKGPRSNPCTPKKGEPPLPCIPNDVWLLVLCFVPVGELGVPPPSLPPHHTLLPDVRRPLT